MPHGHKNHGRERPQNAKAAIKRIFHYIRPYRWLLAVILVLIAISASVTVVGIYCLKPIINDYVIPFIGRQNPDLSNFIQMLIFLAVIYGAGVGATFLYNRLMIIISTNVLKQIRIDIFAHLQELPIRYFDKHSHGEIMSRFTNDTDTLREMLTTSIPQCFSSLLSLLGVLTMMLVLSPLLTLLVFVVVWLMAFVAKHIGKKSAHYFKQQQESIGRVNGYIEEMIEGQKVVKVFNHEQVAQEEFDALNENLRHNAANANTFAIMLMPVMANISYIHYAATAALGGIMCIHGLLDLGSIAAFLQYTRNFSSPITQISQQFNAILMALAGAERIFKLIDEPAEEDEGRVVLVRAAKASDGTLSETERLTGAWAWKMPDGRLQELRGDVRFENVTFSYDGQKTVLDDVSLYAKPGQKIALVGSTGAGKTTITNLVNRFYDIHKGRIIYDDIPLEAIQKNSLRRSLSMVLQDTHLFSGTIMENIRYGNLTATDEEVIAAAKLANADSFIRHLPQGYETEITGDGAGLSQGQRQLLSIARAAVSNPTVLILDEATSSIDTRTEALIEHGMDRLMAGRTVFVIAHRLSTVRNANAILVIENGRIIERGDHDDLLAQKGRYYQLYTGAFELT